VDRLIPELINNSLKDFVNPDSPIAILVINNRTEDGRNAQRNG
jgi:hypothetical protein